jgi:hypothetical protein
MGINSEINRMTLERLQMIVDKAGCTDLDRHKLQREPIFWLCR